MYPRRRLTAAAGVLSLVMAVIFLAVFVLFFSLDMFGGEPGEEDFMLIGIFALLFFTKFLLCAISAVLTVWYVVNGVCQLRAASADSGSYAHRGGSQIFFTVVNFLLLVFLLPQALVMFPSAGPIAGFVCLGLAAVQLLLAVFPLRDKLRFDRCVRESWLQYYYGLSQGR